MPRNLATVRQFMLGGNKIYCMFLALKEGGNLIGGNYSLVFYRSITMRCSVRHFRCTKGGDRHDRRAVAPDDGVSRKNAQVCDGNDMREYIGKQCAVPNFLLYDGAAGTDAKCIEINSARFPWKYGGYDCLVQELQ